MTSAGAATLLKASTKKDLDVVTPVSVVVRANAAPAQPRPTPAPPSVAQLVIVTRSRASQNIRKGCRAFNFL